MIFYLIFIYFIILYQRYIIKKIDNIFELINILLNKFIPIRISNCFFYIIFVRTIVNGIYIYNIYVLVFLMYIIFPSNKFLSGFNLELLKNKRDVRFKTKFNFKFSLEI